MTLNVELTPRRSLTPNDLKRLGTALETWLVTFLRDHPEVDGWMDQDAVADLLAGELPKPFILRCLRDPPRLNINELQVALEKARARHPLLRRMLPPFHGRCVPFGFSLDGEDREELLVSLRRQVPMEFVDKIRINGEGCKGENHDGKV